MLLLVPLHTNEYPKLFTQYAVLQHVTLVHTDTP